MEFMGWADNNGTINETQIYSDIMSDPLLALFYDDIYGACMMDTSSRMHVGGFLEERCLEEFASSELQLFDDLVVTMAALDCWEYYIQEALTAYAKMVLGIPAPVFSIYGLQ